MNKLRQNLNFIAVALLVVGFALWRSFGSRNIIGIALFVLGIVALAAYLVLNREQFKKKNSRLNFIFASNILLIVLLLIAIIGSANYLGTKIHKRIDISEGKIHSLADQSIQVAKNLKKPLAVKAFISENNAGTLFRFRSLMDIYKYYTTKLETEVIDPYKNPAMVKRYEVKADGTVIFEYDNRDTRIEEVSEETITNAIIKVTRGEEKAVYFLQGHGEPDPEATSENGLSEVKSNLEKLSYKVKKLLLFQEPEVPANAAVVIIAGPQKPLLAGELALLETYIQQKQGRVLFLVNPNEGIEAKSLLRKYGLELEDNIVVEADTVTRLMGGDYFMPVVGKYPDHAITKNFGYATMFPMVRGLTKVNPLPQNVTVDVIASTSQYSWGETNYEEEYKTKKMSKNETDKTGPIDIAMAVEYKPEAGKKARLVVVGDSDFILNNYYSFQANGNFLGNIISWLAEEEDLIAITPKTTAPRMINLSQGGARMILYYCVIILPILILLAGIAVWLFRRKL